ncbi:hypothetical protein AcV5_001046 [Taiwanofungus camphoratus]|nr:hypothetical protein AcV5_001046 [Antrodia cinnamomea]
MCKVFKPIGAARCPHIKEVCHNRTAHPRHDVVYLKNAEVQTFSGCGFCKWAATNPPAKLSGYQNPGWPGCCRPPTQNEQKFIGAADWPAVSLVHHIPIPLDIKAILESITGAKGGSGSPGGSIRTMSSQSLAPSMSRRTSYPVSSPTRTENTPTRTPPMPIPTRNRSSGSPQQVAISLTSNTTRNSNGDGSASSLPNRSAMDQYQAQRRSTADAYNDKRSEQSTASQHSPGRKCADLGGSISRRPIERRPSMSAVVPSMSISKVTVDIQPQQRRRAQTTNLNQPPVNVTSSRAADRQNTAPAALQRRGSTLEKAVAAMSISSSSSGSSGSNSETTVISDGGFTDYLSDESEAELQRQAEAKAALVAQNHMEEQEFKAARQQLASVDLRPPKSWTGNINSTPRSQTSTAHSSAYPQASSYASPSYSSGSTSVAGTTHSRG